MTPGTQPDQPPAERAVRGPRAGRAALLVGLLAAAVFLDTLRYDFVWDNAVLIVENHYIKYARHVPDFFRLDYFSLSHGVIAQGFYRPLLALSFFADYRLWGLQPAGYHLTNILFHAAASALVCLLAWRLTAPRAAGALAGVLFALHPVHMESVAFTSGRVDVVAAAFTLGAVLLFLRGSPPSAIGSAGCFAAALLMKEMALTLPAILVLAALAAAPEPGRRRALPALRRCLPHAIVLLGYGLARASVGLPQLLAGKESGAADPLARALTAVATVGRYVQMDLVLFEPTPFYEGRLTTSPLDPWFLLGVAALAAGGWLVAWAWRRDPLLFFGVAWFFVTLIPVANLVPIPGVRDAAIAERYLYIPSIGVCLALGAAAARGAAWAERRTGAPGRGVTAGLLLLAVGLYAPVTLRWTPIWKSNETLYRQMIRRSPESAFPHISLAATLMAQGQAAEAQALVERALALGPTRPEVHRVDGAMRRARGDLDGALAAMQRAHGLMPDSVPTLIELGTTLAERGHLEEALAAFRRALAIDPQAVEADNRMGVAYFRAGRLPQAAQAFRRAAERSPDFVFAHSNLAATLDRLDRPAEALAAVAAALRLAPDDPRLTALHRGIQARLPGASGISVRP